MVFGTNCLLSSIIGTSLVTSRLHVSDVTTLISASLVVVRTAGQAVMVSTVWRCAVILLQHNGLVTEYYWEYSVGSRSGAYLSAIKGRSTEQMVMCAVDVCEGLLVLRAEL